MIICICRDIRSSQFQSEEEIKERIMQNDFKCGLCQLTYLNQQNDHFSNQPYCLIQKENL